MSAISFRSSAASRAEVHPRHRIGLPPDLTREVLQLLPERIDAQSLGYVHRDVPLLVVVGVLELEHRCRPAYHTYGRPGPVGRGREAGVRSDAGKDPLGGP